MRLASYIGPSGPSWGIVQEGGVVDGARRLSDAPTIRALLAGDGLDAARAIAGQKPIVDHPWSDVQLLPVIPDPGQILCIGLNYHEHRLETHRETTGHPTVFARFAGSQVGHGGAIVRPPESETLDFEGELAIVIGQSMRRASSETALGAVAGYACYNDASVREFQRHTSQFHPGKNFPFTGAFGPWLVTSDEVPDYRALSIETRLNGSVVQQATLDQLIFSIPHLIAYCSTFTELRPGDVIVTGTPGGVGAGRTPPLWMKAGDRVEVEIPGIGLLANDIEDEQVSAPTLASARA